jgi:hypothetical protein
MKKEAEEPRPRRSYLVTLNVKECVSPTPKARASGVNFLFRNEGFVWTKIFSCQTRSEATRKATAWFFRLKGSSPAARALIAHTSVKDVAVDDPYNEVFFYKKFRCFDANNKLLEEEKIEQLIKESKGKLRKSKRERKTHTVRSSVEWNTNAKRSSYRPPPLKWTGSPGLYIEPDSGAFILKVKKQSQKTVGTKYDFDRKAPRIPMPRQLKSGKKDGRRVWAAKTITITAGKKVQNLRYKAIRLKAKTLDEAKVESKKYKTFAEI